MGDFFQRLLSTDGYHPHGYCYLWQPGLVWLHVVADSLIGLAYVAIGLALALFVRRARGELPFSRMFVAFGVFIAACGATHFIEVWTLWNPTYWLAGSVKIVTAAASVFTAVAMPPLVPLALSTLRSAKLSETRRVDLEGAHRRLQESDELKTQFFANVSHELRTPLTLVLGPVQALLAGDEMSPDARRQLETVHRNAELLLAHVNDLLDVAKLEAGKMEIQHVRTDLARLVRLSASHFESAGVGRGIALSVEAPETLPAEVDPEKLQRLIFNLLGNAMKFTPADGRVSCVLRAEGPVGVEDGRPWGRARIEVHDNGPGVAPEQREKIFEPFRQGDGGPARRYGGTGLGLAISSDFVALHGGRIWVEDSPLGGAAFIAELPLRAPAGAAVHVEDAGERPAEAPLRVPQPDEPHAHDQLPPALGPSGAPVVLVIEDNAEMNQFIAEGLSRDYRVVRALDGLTGIREAMRNPPDLILSDIMMPGKTGEDLVRETRADPTLRSVPLVLLSARDDDALRIRLLGEGAQDYLTKPFSIEELRARVANWIGIKRTRDILQSELDTTLVDVEHLARSLAARKQEIETALDAARLAVAEAETANRAKADFLSVMSHELRTPLNAIFGYLDLLDAGIAGTLSDTQKRYLSRLKQNSEHLFHLVDEILTYARVEAGTESVQLEQVDLRGVVQEVVEMVAPTAEAKGLSLEMDAPSEPLIAETDPDKVRRILLNLATNAVKFTEHGSVSVSITARDGVVTLAVADTGPGILREHQEKIFEPFWQADLSKTRAAGGTGLGLSISQRLTALLGGDISVESEPGAGTRFVVRLPRSPDRGNAGEGESQESGAPAGREP